MSRCERGTEDSERRHSAAAASTYSERAVCSPPTQISAQWVHCCTRENRGLYFGKRSQIAASQERLESAEHFFFVQIWGPDSFGAPVAHLRAEWDKGHIIKGGCF